MNLNLLENDDEKEVDIQIEEEKDEIDEKFDKIYNDRELMKFLVENKFDWLKDGVNKNGDLKFLTDGTMYINNFNGKWKLNALDTISIQLNNLTDEYIMKKVTKGYDEWALSKILRRPPTKMKVKQPI